MLRIQPGEIFEHAVKVIERRNTEKATRVSLCSSRAAFFFLRSPGSALPQFVKTEAPSSNFFSRAENWSWRVCRSRSRLAFRGPAQHLVHDSRRGFEVVVLAGWAP